jgi:hypothetical protein
VRLLRLLFSLSAPQVYEGPEHTPGIGYIGSQKHKHGEVPADRE